MVSDAAKIIKSKLYCGILSGAQRGKVWAQNHLQHRADATFQTRVICAEARGS
jgi:hypothetical protein